MNLDSISNCILDESSSKEALHAALDAFVSLCSDVSGIVPDTSFDAWAEDSLLESGVAVSPQAAAYCALDYQRSIVFMRAVHAALSALKARAGGARVKVLYAGCGPFGTLLLPLLDSFSPGELEITLLDIHQNSLDSVKQLLTHFELHKHVIHYVLEDASHYTHEGKFHLVIAETMQKSLEQEPQFAVTANLASQLLPSGVFIPQSIEVTLCMANLEREKELLDRSENIDRQLLASVARRCLIATVFTLTAESVADRARLAQYRALTDGFALEPTVVEIPMLADAVGFDAVLFTRITVFEHYCLGDYESQITLPSKCHELRRVASGERYRVEYQLGGYPKLHFDLLG